MKNPKKPAAKKPTGTLLFTLAFDLDKEDITYQTTMPLPRVIELIQNIMSAQQREQGKQEALAELAKQKETKEK